MELSRLLKPALFIYEGLRILVLAVYVIIHSRSQGGLSLVAFAVPGAMFTLMSLFIWLDSCRYKNYINLFIAGKSISVFSLVVWSVFLRLFSISVVLGVSYIETFILSGDLFALAAIIKIYKSEKNKNDFRALQNETSLTEDK